MMMRARKIAVSAVVLIGCQFVAARGAEKVPDAETVLSTLASKHPRLMLTDEALKALKERYRSDKALKKYVQQVLQEADEDCRKPPLVYRKIGPRLLHVSRECLRRIYTLGLAWRWTGRQRYARKAAENLLAVCAFKDWNPLHFLDTAEMSHAVGIGYDWLFSYLDGPTRDKIRAGLIGHGMKPGVVAYQAHVAWWTRSEFNWNQVCNGGLLIGALAIAETDPQYAKTIVPRAVASLPKALRSYGQDGVWMEGPAYWHYATRYTAYGLTALQTALGTDFGLTKIAGLSQTGFFPIYTTGPTGLYLNYADSGENSVRRPMPCLFWLARTYGNAFFADAEHRVALQCGARPEHVVWYVPPAKGASYTKDLDRFFGGGVEVAVMRSAWDDPEALFVGVKSGYNQVNHGHLDLGNFEFDALGVRWARDLGSDDYNLPGYWAKQKGGRRWSYYRLRSASHNVPMLGGQDQDPNGRAKFIKTGSEPSRAFVVVDLTRAYKGFAKKVTRGVGLVENRRAVLVQDEFEIDKPCDVLWGMTTDAEIRVERTGVATLRRKGREMIGRVLCPAGAGFSVASAEQPKPQKPNKGVKRLTVHVNGAKGKVRVAVLFSPVWKAGGAVRTIPLQPLADW